MTAPALVPLDDNAADERPADAELRERYLRKALIEARGSPSRLRLLRSELQEVEQQKPRG